GSGPSPSPYQQAPSPYQAGGWHQPAGPYPAASPYPAAGPYPAASPYGYPGQPAPGYPAPPGPTWFVQAPPPPPPPGSPPHALLPEPGLRLGARAIDAVILILGVLALTGSGGGLQYAFGMGSAAAEAIGVCFGVTAIIVLLCYEPFMTWRYGGTLGKRICGLRVARLGSGESLTLLRALARYWVTIPMAFVPILSPLNVLWCLWDQPNRQCLHDKVVSSVVVKRQP
ncbi:RDD family protein, partial [Streptomyces corynorhini]